MSLWSLLSFTIAVAIAAAMPGPTVVALVARVLARGRTGTGPLLVGLVLADLLWLAASVFGAVALATEAHQVMVVLKYLGAAYLAYLAVKMWTAPAAAVTEAELPETKLQASRPLAGWRGTFGGLAMGLSNPKTMLFYMALVPNLIDLTRLGPLGFAALSTVDTIVLALVLTSYVTLAGRARGLFRSPRAMRFVNRGSGVVIASTAVVVATRQA
ncbi:lysine transporter LysE [Aliidongia dinghuensis]|uniref:Lysine transporter LysE n=1 Tax=Aliidongia dinghuensis TaxID=1867774 RepID=A0A8J2Z088_9PROT|nr:LysE family translocator [Aliidongia dinghuensis]GGF45410.1 lysine transporter LysE [Aliidongia dinghuensis]